MYRKEVIGEIRFPVGTQIDDEFWTYKVIGNARNLVHIDDRLLFEMDDKNLYDEHAIKVIFHKDGKNYHVGYVPRYYAKELTDLLKSNVKYSALVASLNFESQFNDEYITVTVKLIFDTN